ncbi:MAG: hypothetical protein ACKOPG_05845 [Novosphingobium sp.]
MPRLVALVIGVIAIQVMAAAILPGGGTFESKSRPQRSAATTDGDEDGGWGTSTRGRISRDEARARAAASRHRSISEAEESSRADIPVYDPAKDGGWGSN